MSSRWGRLGWLMAGIVLLAWGLPVGIQSGKALWTTDRLSSLVGRELSSALGEHRTRIRQALREQAVRRLRLAAEETAVGVGGFLAADRGVSRPDVGRAEQLRAVALRPVGPRGRTCLVSMDDLRLVVHENPQSQETSAVEILGDDPRLDRLIEELRRGEPVQGVFAWPGSEGPWVESFLWAVPVPAMGSEATSGLAVVAAVPLHDFLEPIQTLLASHDALGDLAARRVAARIDAALGGTVLLSAITVSLGIFLFATLWWTWHLSLRRLTLAARQVSRGNLGSAPELEELGALGALGEALASMVEHLKRTTVTREYLNQVVEGIPAAIMATDAEGRIVLWNEEAHEITGYSAADVLGSTCGQILDFSCGCEEHPCSQISGLPLHQVEMSIRRKDGREITVAKSADILPESDGGPSGTIEVFFDVTEKRRYRDLLLEQKAELQASRATALRALEDLRSTLAALERAKEAAEEGSRLKSQFLANVSHEIRTPLNAIIGFAALLQEGPLFPDEAEYADIIVRSSEHLRELIDQVLDLSKVEAGRVELNHETFDPRALAAAVEEIFRPRAQDKGLEFKQKAAPELPAALVGDGTRIRQILTNLIENAVRFTEQGSVELELGWADSHLLVRVSDTGPGIPEDGLERVFEPFYQVDGSASRRHGGTGLGLSIVRGLTQAMGGDVVVKSRRGEGTTFQVRLPSTEASEEVPAPSDRRAPRQALRERLGRILVVENDPPSARLVRALLEGAGYNVVWAEGGSEGLQRYAEGGWDAVLLDMQMPGMDGYEVARRMGEAGEGGPVPVVALTAHAMDGDRERCLAAGCSEYLPKPVDRAALLALLARLTGNGPAPSEDVEPDGAAALRREYLERARREVSALTEEVATGNLAEVARLAHSLKGSGGTYGFPAISCNADTLDRACRAGDRAAAGEALEDLRHVVASLVNDEAGSPERRSDEAHPSRCSQIEG